MKPTTIVPHLKHTGEHILNLRYQTMEVIKKRTGALELLSQLKCFWISWFGWGRNLIEQYLWKLHDHTILQNLELHVPHVPQWPEGGHCGHLQDRAGCLVGKHPRPTNYTREAAGCPDQLPDWLYVWKNLMLREGCQLSWKAIVLFT